jgi:hypothetical protein
MLGLGYTGDPKFGQSVTARPNETVKKIEDLVEPGE